jgi:hypothetical protein
LLERGDDEDADDDEALRGLGVEVAPGRRTVTWRTGVCSRGCSREQIGHFEVSRL